jgi:hypothetical protein
MYNKHIFMEETRSCTKCGDIKSLSEYYFIKQENRYNKKCKLCVANQSKKHYESRKTSDVVTISEKQCISCSQIKDISQFNKERKQIDGYSNKCRCCSREYNQKYYHTFNSPKLIDPLPEGHRKCTHCEQILPFSEYHKIKKDQPQLNSRCKTCTSIKYDEWKEKNGREWGRDYVKNRRQTDPQFKIKQTLRGRYMDAIKRHTSGGKVNKHHSAIKLIGCPIEFYIEYIETQFHPGMTWENHGDVWEIDHILPCASFDLTISEEQQKCFHYTNTQPLFKSDNRSKGSKLI